MVFPTKRSLLHCAEHKLHFVRLPCAGLLINMGSLNKQALKYVSFWGIKYPENYSSHVQSCLGDLDYQFPFKISACIASANMRKTDDAQGFSLEHTGQK